MCFFPSVVLMLAVAVLGPSVLGRCPLERVEAIISGRFASPDTDGILVLQNVGDVELSRTAGDARERLSLRRLALMRRSGSGLHVSWQSETFAVSGAAGLGLAGSAWAVGDVNQDERAELLMFGAGICRAISFDGDTVRTDTFAFDGIGAEAAACCDLNNDGITDVVTLERPGREGSASARLMRAYQFAGENLAPHQAYEVGIDWGEDTRIALLGAAELDDYPGSLPVVAGIRLDVRPSVYGILYEPKPDSTVFTANPFPWQEWFSKTRVLSAGELSLFNVGDTLVAYGYFVPGARPSGPSTSFAALQDGEWRLLSFTDDAARIAGPVCRFTRDGVAGWLELRDNLFYFYPGEVFIWR